MAARPVRQRSTATGNEIARARAVNTALLTAHQTVIKASTTTITSVATREIRTSATTTSLRPVVRRVVPSLRTALPTSGRISAPASRAIAPAQARRTTSSPKATVSVAPRRSPRNQLSVSSPAARTPTKRHNSNSGVVLTELSSPPSSVYFCPICFINVKKGCVALQATICGHVFCSDCLQKAYERRPNCPICQGAIAQDTFREIFM